MYVKLKVSLIKRSFLKKITIDARLSKSNEINLSRKLCKLYIKLKMIGII